MLYNNWYWKDWLSRNKAEDKAELHLQKLSFKGEHKYSKYRKTRIQFKVASSTKQNAIIC